MTLCNKNLICCSLAMLIWGCNNIPGSLPDDDAKIVDDPRLQAGKSCQNNEDCLSGYCLEIMGIRQCAATCQNTAQCPNTLVCAAANPHQINSPMICMPKAKILCAACQEDSDCQEVGALCHEIDGNSVCLGPCEENAQCPTGYVCQEVIENVAGNTVKQCWPEINTCSCNAASSGAVRQCFKQNAAGTCYGLETCDGSAGGWLTCDAAEPQPEICDGLDNDCDGLTDEDEEGNPLTQMCWYGYENGNPPPECRGVSICQDGNFNNCSLPVPPATESTCDGLDNDCDGMIDEDADGNPLTEVCQYGYEGREAPENCRGIQTCENGRLGECSTPKPPENETLCDNIDEDCDGYTDAADHFGTPLTTICGYGYEDNPASRPAYCSGLRACHHGVFGECDLTPPAKDLICDGKDEDCDGRIDEDILGTNDNCTKCGDVCPGKNKPNVAKWGCSNGRCIDWSCKFPYFDVNNLEGDGCEINDPLLNYKPSLAKNLGTLSECNDNSEIHQCNGRLPRDKRANINNNNDMSNYEGQDYFYFYYDSGTWCAKEAVLKLVGNRLTGNYGTKIRVCISQAYSTTTSSPQFTDTSRCKTLAMGSYNSAQLVFDKSYFNKSGSNNYYILVESDPTTPYFAGSFHLQIMEQETANDITGANSVCK